MDIATRMQGTPERGGSPASPRRRDPLRWGSREPGVMGTKGKILRFDRHIWSVPIWKRRLFGSPSNIPASFPLKFAAVLDHGEEVLERAGCPEEK